MAAMPPPPPPPPAAPPPLYSDTYGASMQYAAPPAPPRSGWILVAQILMVVKGILWLIFGLGIGTLGIYLLAHGADVRQEIGPPGYHGLYGLSKGLAGVAVAFTITAGAFCLAVGVADILLGVTLGRPSNAARWFTVVLTSIAGVIAVLGIVGQAGNRGGGAGGVVFLAVWLAVNIVIFYALVIDERSRRVFG